MLALQALCVLDALGEEFTGQLDDFLRDPHVHADLGLDPPPVEQALAFARRLTLGTWQQRGRYDQLVQRQVTRWSLSRMPPVDRNILRLGTHELCQRDPDRPPQVVIDEAIELARCFSAADAPGFVNGVLDAIRRELAPEQGLPAQPPGGRSAPEGS